MNILGVVVDPLVVTAIMAIAGGGIASFITQLIKNKLNISGNWAVLLTGAVAVVCVAIYFLVIAPPFVLVNFLVYAAVVFGEATGYYHFFG